jgi:S-DNA-T family DNA segregation ATPase FtsK/SpoIIIE
VLLELDTSVLVVGESGSGKSNLSWFILNELNGNSIPYRLFVIDPKKVELAELVDSPYTVGYADNPNGSDEVILKFYTEMMDTFERMKKTRCRRILISPTNPLKILIVDEVLLCKAFKEGLDGPLGEILSAGRAAGYIVIANSQLGQVDAISRLRDLFPQRICMAVKSVDLTNAVLGPNAEARGARCSEITQKGVGYVYTDHSGAFQRFRPPLITDVQSVALGHYVDPTGPKGKNRTGKTV